MKHLVRLSCLVALVGMAGCASRPVVNVSQSQVGGQPVPGGHISCMKYSAGVLVFPVAFASQERAKEKLRRISVERGLRTESGITADGKWLLTLENLQLDEKAKGAWFLLGWTRGRMVTGDIRKYPYDGMAPAVNSGPMTAASGAGGKSH